MPESKTSQRRLEAFERGCQALELRKQGLSYTEIGAQLGLTKTGAYKSIMRALKRTMQEPADELRQIEGARLDTAQSAIWDKVKGGDVLAIDRFVRISERRSKLFGLDAPTRTNIRLEEVDAEIERQLALLAGGGEAGDADPAARDECGEEEAE